MSKKKKGKFAHKKKSNKGLVTALVLILLLLVALVAVMLLKMPEDASVPAETDAQTVTEAAGNLSTQDSQLPQSETAAPEAAQPISIDYGIRITDMGSYTGMYMEDGTDEILSGIMMLVVENTGEDDIQYAEITMDLGEQEAQFSLTTLPVGESMVLLEKNRMAWDDSRDYKAVAPMIQNVAYFQEPISTMEDKLKIGIMDGAINVTNISGEDIPGTIAVYYKNAAADIYYGGITYRIQIQGGLKADEIRQVMTNHASDTGSKIMFVTISQ